MMTDDNRVAGDPPAQAVRAELHRITQSADFSGARRLREFLDYVVEETLAGRGNAILGKTIAADVYGRNVATGDDQVNVVRVDAGRLRRRLKQFYAANPPTGNIEIRLEPGSYAPEIVISQPASRPVAETRDTTGTESRRVVAMLAIGALAAAGVLLWAAFWWAGAGSAPGQGGGISRAERQALLEKGPAALQAANLAGQARNIVFPAVDPGRLAAARSMFEQAVRLDPGYAGGHAGVAQTSAGLALVTPDPERRAAFLETARNHAANAVRLDPTNGWSQSAMAWSAFAAGNAERAGQLSALAVQLSPGDPYVLDFDTLIALFSGRFDQVIASVRSFAGREDDHDRHVYPSAYAAALFHTGRYGETIDLMTASMARGGLAGPMVQTYLVAANQMAGHETEARRLAGEFVAAWPETRMDLLLFSVYTDPSHARAVLDPLAAAGWRPGDDTGAMGPRGQSSPSK